MVLAFFYCVYVSVFCACFFCVFVCFSCGFCGTKRKGRKSKSKAQKRKTKQKKKTKKNIGKQKKNEERKTEHRKKGPQLVWTFYVVEDRFLEPSRERVRVPRQEQKKKEKRE